jgi:hypothetical protein
MIPSGKHTKNDGSTDNENQRTKSTDFQRLPEAKFS